MKNGMMITLLDIHLRKNIVRYSTLWTMGNNQLSVFYYDKKTGLTKYGGGFYCDSLKYPVLSAICENYDVEYLLNNFSVVSKEVAQLPCIDMTTEVLIKNNDFTQLFKLWNIDMTGQEYIELPIRILVADSF